MKRTETEIKAAFFTADYDDPPTFVRLDSEYPERVGLCELLGNEQPSNACIRRLIEAPIVPIDGDDFTAKAAMYHAQHVEEAKAHPVRVYRVRVVTEYELLPQDEAERWVAEALARDVARSTKDGE